MVRVQAMASTCASFSPLVTLHARWPLSSSSVELDVEPHGAAAQPVGDLVDAGAPLAKEKHERQPHEQRPRCNVVKV